MMRGRKPIAAITGRYARKWKVLEMKLLVSGRGAAIRPLLAGVAGLAIGAGVTLSLNPPVAGAATSRQTMEYLELFGDVFEQVRSKYVEEIDEPKALEAALNGMLTSLDPHSSYLPPQGFKDMQVQTKGEFGGLGIEVSMENGFVKVVSPIDDTPAARAGLQSGDFITHLDGEAVLGLTLQEAVERMRGIVGTPIKLTILRQGKDEPFDVTLTRDTIKITAVRSRAEGDIGYLRITTFNEQTHENLVKGVDKLKKEIGPDKIRGYVIDLRNNPGGLLTQAIAVSDSFLDKGEIVSTRGRDVNDISRSNATTGDITDGKPLVVIVNAGSASASEIVAGALQDHRRAVVIGVKTFGKGSVQTIMPLQGKGALRLTTARYYTPSGRSIQGLGIEPDIVVQQAKLEVQDAKTPARAESNLRGSLSNDSMTEADKAARQAEEKAAEEAAKRRAEDYQLGYALDLLRGISIYDKLRR